MRPPEYWRDKAEEARNMAGEMTNEDSQQTLLGIAQQYEDLARLAEQEQQRERRLGLWPSASPWRSS
jgi:hypothetical protein